MSGGCSSMRTVEDLGMHAMGVRCITYLQLLVREGNSFLLTTFFLRLSFLGNHLQNWMRNTCEQWDGDPSSSFFPSNPCLQSRVDTHWGTRRCRVTSYPPQGCTASWDLETQMKSWPQRNERLNLWEICRFRILPCAAWPTAINIAMQMGVVRWYPGRFSPQKSFFRHSIKTAGRLATNMVLQKSVPVLHINYVSSTLWSGCHLSWS